MHNKRKKRAPKPLSFTALLQQAGLRPTQQRLALAVWLFDGVCKHVTAEDAHRAMQSRRAGLSLATVYNNLNVFTEAGLLRQLVIDGTRVYFDSNIEPHHHILDEKNGHLTDVPAAAIRFALLPPLPRGKKLSRVDVILRVN